MTTPMAARPKPWRITMPRTLPGLAPRAMRSPISFVRRATENAMTP